MAIINLSTCFQWIHCTSLTTSNHSDVVLLQVDSLNTPICSVTRSGELVTWFNVHQSTRVELRDSLMYYCHTINDRNVQEGTSEAHTSQGGLELIFNGVLWWSSCSTMFTCNNYHKTILLATATQGYYNILHTYFAVH